MISSQFESTFHWVWRMKGTSIMKTPAMTAPQSVKMPPISAVAINVRDCSRGNEPTVGLPKCEASRHPATPVMNDASANAHILYSVMLTPAASAAGSLSRIAAHARPGLLTKCTSASRNRSAQMTTTYR